MKMEETKEEIDDDNIRNSTKEKEKTFNPQFQMNTMGIDIVKAIVDDAIVPKIIENDMENSNDIVQNIIEEVLVTNIIHHDDRNLPGTRELNNCSKKNKDIADRDDTKSDLSNNEINNIDKSNSTSNEALNLNVEEKNISINKSKMKDNNAPEAMLQNSLSNEVPEVVDLSLEDKDARSSTDEKNSDDETGDPSKNPGQDAIRPIDPDHLLPFHHGWKREVVMKNLTKNSATQCEIFYIPPTDSPYRTRESKRKRKSKMDQERYFDDFPHKQLSVQNFSYVPRPLGLNNTAYEIIRKPGKIANDDEDDQGRTLRDSLSPSNFGRRTMGGVSYKEVEETTGLLESGSSDDEDEEVRHINGLDTALPLSDQITLNLAGMKSLHKKRRKYRNPETCCTPPLAEDMLWSTLDDDPLGIYHSLGGRSSPTTPPPLRAVKLTPCDTAVKIASCYEDVKNEAASHQCLKEVELSDGYLASHDVAIKKYKNVKEQHYRLAFARNKMGQILRAGQSSYQPKPVQSKAPQASYLNLNKQQSTRISQEKYSFSKKSSTLPQVQTNSLVVRKATCSVNCPGARRILPTMQCINCRCLYHAKCQGVSDNVKVFKCRACVASSAQTSSLISPMSNVVRVKLPMVPVNGKRPIVELVMMQGGKYQPIKFSNNMQVTEEISKRVFDQANNMKKTIYQRAKQVPNVGNRPIYLAVNPSNPATGNALKQQQSKNVSTSQNNVLTTNNSKPPSSNTNSTSDQVSILVKQQNSGNNTKPVLLNVPRKVALKVKTGTTLSFSASNDQKYVVIDNKIHPPVKVASTSTSQTRSNSLGPRIPGQGTHQMKNTYSNKPTSLKGISNAQMNLPSNLPTGLSIKRSVAPHAPLAGNQNLQRQIANRKRQVGSSITGPQNKYSRPASNILATGEILSNAQSGAMNPCTPYCPGVNGFPELECTGCQSLFHSKCVGISQTLLPRLMATWKCRMCTSQSSGAIQTSKKASLPVQVIELD